MTWANWTTYATSVLDFFLSIVPRMLDLIMSNPLLGVPVILLIISLIMGIVQKFVGSFGSNNSKTES